ncbi:MAG TPA: hypothetical protein VIK01_03990, partial [Polyangiaceae bacterium]
MARRREQVMKASGGLIGLLVVSWSSALAAQPTARFALSWNGPPGCPTAENIQARVDALLGGAASASRVADVRASGQVERVDNGFRLLLSMGVGSTPSSRVIEARTCDELAGAAAIAIALLARSTAEGGSAPAIGESTPASAPSAAPPNSAPAPLPSPNHDQAGSTKDAPPVEPPPGGLHLLIDAPIGAAGWGSLPSAGLGLGAALGVRWKGLRATVGGELWQPQTDRVSGFASHFALQSGRAEACFIQAVHGLELGPCLGAAAQRLAGEGVGSQVFSANSRTTLWISGSGGLFVSLPTP